MNKKRKTTKNFKNQYFEVILESLPHPFYVINADTYSIIFANKAAKQLGASSAATCYALTHRRGTPCDGKEHPCPLLMVKETKEPAIVEHIHYDNKGNMIHVEVHGYPILNNQGEVIQMIEYSINITARKIAEEKLRKTNEIYQCFVPKEFLKHLGQKNITDIILGQQTQKEMTVLFSDIRSFTTISEDMTPGESFKFINSVLNIMGPAIRNNSGFIDKFIGDAIMALFGKSPEDAIDAAISMHKTLAEYNEDRTRAGCFPVRIGVGINTGLLVLGVIGESGRMEGTVIGDAVNLTSRIEGLTKEYGVSILISQNTLSSMKNQEKYMIRFIDWVKVKGKDNPLPIYEVFDTDPPELRNKKQKTLELFQEAIAQYQLKRIDKSMDLFEKCIKLNPQDQPAKVYLKRCRDYLGGHFKGPEELIINREWSEELATGHKIIDDQHKELFHRINILIDSIRIDKEEEEMQKVVVFLEDYVIEHFSSEENIMRKHRYPELPYHHGLHNKFVQDFREIKKGILRKESNLPCRVLRIHILLIDWLINHISNQDKRFSKYMRGY